jgi:hypothetical protein
LAQSPTMGNVPHAQITRGPESCQRACFARAHHPSPHLERLVLHLQLSGLVKHTALKLLHLSLELSEPLLTLGVSLQVR